MKFAEYKEEVKRTLPDLGKHIIADSEGKGYMVDLNVIHVIMGMVSEINELNTAIDKGDNVNIGEEITDILWYACNYCNLHKIDGVYEVQTNIDGLRRSFSATQRSIVWEDLIHQISILDDIEKKLLAYGRVIDADDQLRRINTIMTLIDDMYEVSGLDAEKCMQNNIDKLRVRFPDKFNNEQANNRNLDNELKELKK